MTLSFRIANRERVLATLAAALLVSACVFAAYGVVPSRAEVSDPLGMPVRLVRTITASADAFDRNTPTLVGQNTTLRERTGGVGGVATSVARLQDQAARLAELVKTLDARTAGVGTAAKGLPGNVDGITGSAQHGATDLGSLEGGIGGLDTALGRLTSTLGSMNTDVVALGPRAQTLAATLVAIRQDTAALGFLQALLGTKGSGR